VTGKSCPALGLACLNCQDEPPVRFFWLRHTRRNVLAEPSNNNKFFIVGQFFSGRKGQDPVNPRSKFLTGFQFRETFLVDSIEILANIAGMPFDRSIPMLRNSGGVRC
jgi:hypothetical protein